jgi:hypothetical protein
MLEFGKPGLQINWLISLAVLQCATIIKDVQQLKKMCNQF